MTFATAGGRPAPGIRLRGLGKEFPGHIAVDGVDVEVGAGELTVLLGPSGCGKSTLLRMIAGFESPSRGEIVLGDHSLGDLPPAKRDIAMVFQNYALFPHLTVAENITFGLSVRRTGRAETAERLAAVARLMGLETLLERKPAQLSGGQQQRVALARAVISERPVCLMDEPLSNLDAKLRAEMRVEIRNLQKRLGLTMVYVTHDQVEAMTMADRIVLMNAGRVEQEGRPEEIYAHPASTFAARFIGSPPMNLIPAAALGIAAPECTVAGLRPEDMTLAGAGVAARLVGSEYLGADLFVTLDIGGTEAVLRQPARAGLPAGEAFHITWAPDALRLFDPGTGRALPPRQ
ncbi:ABC transporter ATP-binding protein [Solirhodobacter olei]|uniref:ABC transporter ATP-binding protein n=1 Tax=Solirhodobacter olei TaxID=2493082 RepID=UPI000FDC0C89|nr:ABC transporter ATP-binding protein [Solirhodobacter olei]